MSRPKYYWYGIVKKMIMRYPQIKEEKSIQTGIFVNAIEKALKETKEMENGDTRIEANYYLRIKKQLGECLWKCITVSAQ